VKTKPTPKGEEDIQINSAPLAQVFRLVRVCFRYSRFLTRGVVGSVLSDFARASYFGSYVFDPKAKAVHPSEIPVWRSQTRCRFL
jgi:hypothetical protein